MSSTSQQDAINAYIANIQAQYQLAESYVKHIQTDASQINHYNSKIGKQTKQYVHHSKFCPTPSGGGGKITWTTWHWTNKYGANTIAGWQKSKSKVNSDMKAWQSKVEAIDPAFASIDSVLDSLLNSVTGIINQHFDADTSDDFTNVQKYLNSYLFKAMDEELQSDMYSAILSGSGGGDLSPSDMMKFAALMVKNENAELGTLSQLTTAMADDVTKDYHLNYDHAEGDSHRYNWFDEVFGDGYSCEANDKGIQANALAMIQLVTDTINNLSPLTASLMPEFVQINIVLKDVFEQVEKILEEHLPPKVAQQKIIALVVYALSFLDLVKQEAEDQKARNQQQMSQATMDAAQMNIDDATMNAQIQKYEAAKQELMKNLMIAAQVIMGAAFMVMAPGVGTALLVGAMTAVDTCATAGVIEDPATAVGNYLGIGKIGGDIVYGGLEMALTVCGGAILDGVGKGVANRLAETASKDVVEVELKEDIQVAAKEAAAAAGKGGDQDAVNRAEAVITQSVKKSSAYSAKAIYELFMQQPFGTILASLRKGGLKLAMENAAKLAGETSIKDSAQLAKIAASGVRDVAPEEVDDLSKTVGAKTVSSLTKVDVKDAMKLIDNTGWNTGWRAALKRGVATAFFATGNTNLWIDIAQKAHGKDDSDAWDDFMTALSVAQGLLEMLAFVAGSGALSSAVFEGAPTGWMRLAGLLQMSGTALEAGSNYEQGVIYNEQADTVQAVSETGSLGDFLQMFLEQMSKDNSQEQNRAIQDESASMQSTRALAGHTQDGEAAGIQVLTEQAV